MIELFPNVTDDLIKKTKFWINIALLKKNPYNGAKIITNFKNRLKTQEEKDYVDFAFKVKLMELEKNEDYPN